MNPTHLSLTDFSKIVMGCAPAALTSIPGDGRYVSLKNFSRCTIIIPILNATTVTGGAITLLQATAVAGTGEKALAFTTAKRNIDCAAADSLASFAVSSNTFTTDTTNSKQLMYVIEVDAAALDTDNGFDCLRVDSTLMAAAVGAAIYILHGARYSPPDAIAAITD